MHNQFKTQKFKHLMLAMGPRDLNSAPYSPVHCSSHSMTSFQSSELTELPVVENSQLFAQRTVRPLRRRHYLSMLGQPDVLQHIPSLTPNRRETMTFPNNEKMEPPKSMGTKSCGSNTTEHPPRVVLTRALFSLEGWGGVGWGAVRGGYARTQIKDTNNATDGNDTWL